LLTSPKRGFVNSHQQEQEQENFGCTQTRTSQVISLSTTLA